MTPYKSVIRSANYRHKKHPNWKPYEYKHKIYNLSPADQENNKYSIYRLNLIEQEAQFVFQIKAQQEKEKGGTDMLRS